MFTQQDAKWGHRIGVAIELPEAGWGLSEPHRTERTPEERALYYMGLFMRTQDELRVSRSVTWTWGMMFFLMAGIALVAIIAGFAR